MQLRLLDRGKNPLKKRTEIAFLGNAEGNGAVLELTRYESQKKFIQAKYENRLFDHLAFEVGDMEKTIALMRKEKITVIDEPVRLGPAGPLIAFIEDPDGTLIELIQRK